MLENRSARLARYVDETADTDKSWRSKCWLVFIGEWVRGERPDYGAEDWLALVEDEQVAWRELERRGGPEAVFRAEIAKAGFPLACPFTAADGDIALLRIPKPTTDETVALGAIRSSGRWVIRTPSGVFHIADRESVRPHYVWKI